jgi:GntR family transcriptional regulator
MKHRTADELGVVTRHSGISFYYQLYRILERALSEGTIPAGSALPSETELMGRFQVSRNTVRRALGQLEKEKRIVRRRGSGSFARSGPHDLGGIETLTDFLNDDEAVRQQTASHLVRIQIVVTPEVIRRREPLFGEKSLLIQRSHHFRDMPFQLITSHVPHPMAERLTRGQLAETSVLLALDTLGIKAFSAEQTTTAVAADTITARHLAVKPEAPLLCIYRMIRDGDGRAIEHQTIVYRPDRYQLRETLLLERGGDLLTWSRTSAHRIPAWR